MWDSREQDAGGPKDRETHAGRMERAAPRSSLGQILAGVWRSVGAGGGWVRGETILQPLPN